MDTSKSEFFHFGILPRRCIYSLKENKYSKMYQPQKTCDCGCEEWLEATMMGKGFPEIEVQICKKCNELRMAYHIGLKDEE